MKIVKTKFLCKNSSQSCPRGLSLSNIQLEDRFIERKWYDGEYENWSQQLYKLNGGWKRYWVVNEMYEKEEIPKAHMDDIFEMNIEELRDAKINDILK